MEIGNKYHTKFFSFRYLGNKIKIAYYDEGEGVPLIFIPGIISSKEFWNWNLPYFIPSFRCIAMDLPGFGNSSKPIIDYTFSFYIKSIVKFINSLKLKKVVFIGNSFGGQLALFYAKLYPEKVHKIVLVDPSGITHIPISLLEFLFKPLGKIVKIIKPNFLVVNLIKLIVKKIVYTHFYNTPSFRQEILKISLKYWEEEDIFARLWALYSSTLAVISGNIRDKIEDIRIPTLIIWGKEDKLLNFKNAYFLKKRLRNSEVYIAESCGHFPMIEKKDKFNKIVGNFLKD